MKHTLPHLFLLQPPLAQLVEARRFPLCMSRFHQISVAVKYAMLIPMKVMEKCIGVSVLCVLSDGSEVEGTLVQYDSTCTLLLKDAAHYVEQLDANHNAVRSRLGRYSEMIVNSHHLHLLVPGVTSS